MDDRLVTVASFDDTVRANIARSALEEAGIQAFLSDENAIGMLWSYSNALGGIKLQVIEADAVRAEYILEQSQSASTLAPEAETGIYVPTEAKELADDLEEEREEKNASNQLADHAFRAVVVGLLLAPFHLYAVWLLICLFFSREKLSPNRRWKVWVSCILNYALWAAVLLVFLLLMPFYARWAYPDGNHWKPLEFHRFERSGQVLFPAPLGTERKLNIVNDAFKNPDGTQTPYLLCYDRFDDLAYSFAIYKYPESQGPFRAEQVCLQFAKTFAQNEKGEITSQQATQVNDFPAQDVTISMPKKQPIRMHLLFIRGNLYALWVAGPPDRIRSFTAEKFLKSLQLD